MAFQHSADSFGIRCLGFKCTWLHPRQANDVLASEPSIFSEITFIKVFPCRGEHVRTYIFNLGSRCAWWQKTTNRHTHTHTRDNYSNPSLNARFSESDLLGALLNSDNNQVLPDSTSSVHEDNDVSSSSYNSDDSSDSDPLDYVLYNYGLYLVLTVYLSCMCTHIVFIVLYCCTYIYISTMLCIFYAHMGL